MTAKITADASGTKVTIGTAAEDALQIDATAKTIKAVSPYNLVAGKATAQTWQDVTASRAIANTYTNSTGQPIEVSIFVSGPAGGANSGGIEAYCQGQKVAEVSTTASNGTVWNSLVATLNFRVPDGAAYQLLNKTVSNTLIGWKELRV